MLVGDGVGGEVLEGLNLLVKIERVAHEECRAVARCKTVVLVAVLSLRVFSKEPQAGVAG
jgi:hypothetical protein